MSSQKIRLADGWEIDASEWLHQPRFSTGEFGSTASVNLVLFSYVVGQQVATNGLAKRSATDLDTNMVKRKGMAQDEAMIVFAVTFDIYGLSDAPDYGGVNVAASPPEYSAINLRRLQRNLVFSLLVGADITKPMLGVPFSEIAQSMGPVGYASGVGATDTLDQGTSGVVSGKNQRTLDLPIYIGGYGEDNAIGNSMQFQANLYNPDGPVEGLTQDTRVRIVLDGLTKLPY